jgi:hypothetical protein
MNLRFFFVFICSAVLLTSCNIFRIFPRADLNLSLIDGDDRTLSQIEFTEVFLDEEDGEPCSLFSGVRIQKPRLMANSRPGSIGVDIDKYSVDYFWADGDEIPTGSGEAFRGTLSLPVPDGVVCSEFPSNEEPHDCTINTPGATWAPGATVISQSFSPSGLDIYNQLAAAGSSGTGAYASIVVEGTDSNGNAYSRVLNPVTLVIFSVCE